MRKIKFDIKNGLNSIVKYSLFFPILVYFIGFLYVQGLLTPFAQNIPGSLFSLARTYPISQQLYLIKGITLIIRMLIPLLIGLITLFVIVIIINEVKKSYNFTKLLSYLGPVILLTNLLPYLILWFGTSKGIYNKGTIYNLIFESVFAFSLFFSLIFVKFSIDYLKAQLSHPSCANKALI